MKLYLFVSIIFLFLSEISNSQVIEMSQYDQDIVDFKVSNVKGELNEYLFVHIHTSDTIKPVLIQSYSLYWDYFRNLNYPDEFADSLQKILQRNTRIVQGDSIPSSGIIKTELYNSLKNKYSVNDLFDKYIDSTGKPKWSIYPREEMNAVLAILIDRGAWALLTKSGVNVDFTP